MNRVRRLAVDAVPVLLGTLVLLALLEVGARLLVGAPRGIFCGFLPGTEGLYPANATIEMIWGPIPYRISPNSLGLRGRELPSVGSTPRCSTRPVAAARSTSRWPLTTRAVAPSQRGSAA